MRIAPADNPKDNLLFIEKNGRQVPQKFLEKFIDCVKLKDRSWSQHVASNMVPKDCESSALNTWPIFGHPTFLIQNFLRRQKIANVNRK